uniref:Uncharacterized protein n=1 Tax=Neolamprologus brichardi TaxID=32507 RepID=A0A3Q4HX71_NEOBR
MQIRTVTTIKPPQGRKRSYHVCQQDIMTPSSNERSVTDVDESLQTSLTSPMSSVIKRSKALRFYGLMGKRSGNKGEMFVGLMGRSISSGGKHKISNRPHVNCRYFKISRQLY